jgi:hypothetical protein
MQLEFCRQILGKSSYMKFNENPASDGRFVPCGRTDTVKQIVAFRNVANSPKTKKLRQVLLFKIGE